MKQTTFYALQAIRSIDQEGGGVTTSKAIATKENISQGVLMKVLHTLQKAVFLVYIRDAARSVVDSH